VKTISSWVELEELLKLRHKIFHLEHHGRTLETGVDIDDIDFLCDHLIIIDRESETIVGSYRLTSTLFSTRFYSQSHFDLSRFLALPGIKLELGRACVDKSFRIGATLSLLWKGIGEYVKATGAAYLFGSASIRTHDREKIGEVWNALQSNGQVDLSSGVKALAAFEVQGLEQLAKKERGQASSSLDTIPSLFQSYLRAGAKVAALPVFDPFMKSTDFLTVLKFSQIHPRFSKRFG
jgi:putative hemolysin